jgi:hypothetical protein
MSRGVHLSRQVRFCLELPLNALEQNMKPLGAIRRFLNLIVCSAHLMPNHTFATRYHAIEGRTLAT